MENFQSSQSIDGKGAKNLVRKILWDTHFAGARCRIVAFLIQASGSQSQGRRSTPPRVAQSWRGVGTLITILGWKTVLVVVRDQSNDHISAYIILPWQNWKLTNARIRSANSSMKNLKFGTESPLPQEQSPRLEKWVNNNKKEPDHRMLWGRQRRSKYKVRKGHQYQNSYKQTLKEKCELYTSPKRICGRVQKGF